jgi:flavorubredoxin
MEALADKLPDLPVYCTSKAKQFLESQYRRKWNCKVVKTGDKLDLGGYELLFIEAPMLHWPDTMFAYAHGMETLFSSDAFGQHYVSSGLYDDEAEQDILWREAIKYYANIVAPYSRMVKPKIDQFLGLGLALELICPSHGVIWKADPLAIVNKYLEWAAAYKEDRIAIIYDSMWHETRIMAEALARGAAKTGATVKVINAGKTDTTQVMTEAFRSAGIMVGSPTVNNGISHAMAAVMEGLRHLKLTGKIGAAFGSYGWSGEGADILQTQLEQAGVRIAGGPLKQTHMPEAGDIAALAGFGEAFAKESGDKE